MNMDCSAVIAAQIHSTEQRSPVFFSGKKRKDIVGGSSASILLTIALTFERQRKAQDCFYLLLFSIPCAIGGVACQNRRHDNIDLIGPFRRIRVICRCRPRNRGCDLCLTGRNCRYDAVFIYGCNIRIAALP